jgi:hypothetical protein
LSNADYERISLLGRRPLFYLFSRNPRSVLSLSLCGETARNACPDKKQCQKNRCESFAASHYEFHLPSLNFKPALTATVCLSVLPLNKRTGPLMMHMDVKDGLE